MSVDSFFGTDRMAKRLRKSSTSVDASSMFHNPLLGARMMTERLLVNSPGSVVMSRAINTFFWTKRELETDLLHQQEMKVGLSMN